MGMTRQGNMQQLECVSQFGINLISYVTANIGIGHVAREIASVILESGVPLSILDLDAGSRSKFDLSFAPYTVETAKELPYGVNLVMVGANALEAWMMQSLDSPANETRLNVAFLWWELPDLAPHWIEAARGCDALIAGSEFIQATLANAVPGVPVLLARQPVRMPQHVLPNRARFGLPAEELLFYTGFEPYSDPIRKNPFGAIEAFQRAFPNQTNCRLVIKVNNPDAYSASGGLLKKLYEMVRDDSRFHLLKESLPYEDLLSLYASCDVFISLHRSEGLGMVPLEAMRLGKAVVATAWSGNMSYMNHRNACLVTYEFQPTDDSSPLYGPSNLGIQSHWAEPDLDHAAVLLRKLATDSTFRAAIGAKAEEDSARYEALARQGDFLDELKAIWAHRELYPQRDRNLVLSRIRKARHQMHLDRLGSVRRIATELSERFQLQMNRHILWRFQGGPKKPST